MIAKRIERKKATSSMAGLARYIMNLDGGISPRDWKLTCDYIIDNDEQKSEKVAAIRVTNCHTDDPVMATEFILKTQNQNKKSKTDKTYHLVLSFPIGETPEKKILYEIEDKFCAALGYDTHQRISAIHQDTDNLHIHIAINKINPDNFRNYEPFFDKRTLMKTCRQIEQEYGLTKTPHGFDHKTEQYSEHEIRNSDNIKQSQTKDFESKTGMESLSTYVGKRIKEFDYTDWLSLHKSLADHGLIIKKRGNGLVIGANNLDLWVKASSCDRSLSLSTLEKKLGPYQDIKQNIQKQYKPMPSGKNNQAKAFLYSQYEEQKKKSDLERQKRYQILYEQKTLFYRQLSIWYKQQSSSLKLIPKNLRVTVRNTLKLQKARRQQELREKQAIVKKKLSEAKFPTWYDWIYQQANIGNKDAIDVLSSMSERRAILSNNLLTTKTAQKTGEFLRKSLNSYLIKNGNMLYKSVDGGVIIDAGETIHAQKFTTGSAYIALSLAVEKFKDQSLILNGTEEFKTEVARLAGIHNMNVVFADPSLNVVKNEAKKLHKNNTENPLQTWINKRNQYSGNLPYVMWNEEEGIFKYVGRRRIGEKYVLLFEAHEKIFVKETPERRFIQAKYWKIGENIKVTKNSYKRLSNKEIGL